MSTIDGQEKVLACKEHIVNQVNKSFGQSAQFDFLNFIHVQEVAQSEARYISQSWKKHRISPKIVNQKMYLFSKLVLYV